MATININASKDASALQSNDGWSGYDDHHPVGSLGSNVYCSFIYFPISFTGWTGVSSATLNIRAHRAGSGNHVLGASSGNSRTLYVHRMTSDWGEGTNRGENLWSSSESWGWNNRRNAKTTTGEGTRVFSGYSDGTWYTVDITEIVQAWYNGSPNYGVILVLAAGSEDDDTNALEFYSRQAGSSYAPNLDITYTTNTAPNAPSGLSPTGDALVNSLTPTLTGTRSDPDSGDYISAYQILFYADDGTTLLWDSGTITVSGTTTTVFSKVYSGSALTGNTFYKWKARTRDKGSSWGAYSALQRFKVNTPPNTPNVALSESPASDIMTLTPTINVTHSDNDPGDTKMYGYRIIVETSGGTSVWDSGDIDTSGAPITTKVQTYAGPALSWASGYRVRARTKDVNGVWGTYSANLSFSTHKTGVAINMDPNTEVVSSLTPTFYAERASSADTIDIYNIKVYSADGNTLIWDGGTMTTNIVNKASYTKVYAGTALAFGTTYLWQTRLISNGVGGFGDWSPLVPFTTPADATVPTLTATPATNGRVTSLTPTLTGTRATTFTNYQIEVYPSTATSTNLGTPIWDSTNTSQAAATSFNRVYSGTALVWNTSYKWRARVGSPTLGSWTGLTTLTTDAAGVPSLTAPTNGQWITTLTPTMTGTAAAGDSITAYRIRLYDAAGTTLIWDSGDIAQTSASTFSKVYNGPALVGGVNYQWEARYTKSTGPTGPYSARFIFHPNAAPTVPTGLVPTPGFVNSGNLLPTFKANFEDPDKNSQGDTPTSWVIEIRNNATDAVIQTKTLSTGLTAGQNVYVWGTNTGGADTALAYNTVYKWRTWFVDSKSATGAASSYQTFSNGQPPTATITAPTNGSNINTTRPTVTWTYSDPGSLTQGKIRITVTRVSNGVKVYDSGEKVQSTTSFQIPTGYLTANTEDYTIALNAFNSGGLQSATSSVTVSLQLAAPPKINGLSATVEPEQSKITLDWDASSLAANFVTYVIYRRPIGESEWTMIGTKKPETNTIFVDWYAGQRRTYEYRVTVVKLIAGEPDLESPDSDIVTTILDADTWMVIGKDRATEHIFELPVDSENHNRPVQQESFEPIGSNRKAVVRGFVLGHEGTMDVLWTEEESFDARAQIEYLLYYAGPHILKNPFGDVYDVTFGSPDFQYNGGGSLSVTLTWIETGATNNPGLSPDEYLAQIGAE